MDKINNNMKVSCVGEKLIDQFKKEMDTFFLAKLRITVMQEQHLRKALRTV